MIYIASVNFTIYMFSLIQIAKSTADCYIRITSDCCYNLSSFFSRVDLLLVPRIPYLINLCV